MSHVKMLMKCLTGENTLAWEHAWSGILMAVHVDSWVKDFPTDILAQTLLSKPGKAAQTLPIGVIVVCVFIIKPVHQSAWQRVLVSCNRMFKRVNNSTPSSAWVN